MDFKWAAQNLYTGVRLTAVQRLFPERQLFQWVRFKDIFAGKATAESPLRWPEGFLLERC